MLLPVRFVLVADFVFEREAGVPIVRALGFGDAWEFGHEAAISINPADRNDSGDDERIGGLLQLAAGVRDVIAHADVVSRLHLQIVREPFVDDHFIVLHLRWRVRRACCGDHRVWGGARIRLDKVREIGQNTETVAAAHRIDDRLIQKDTVCAQPQRRAIRKSQLGIFRQKTGPQQTIRKLRRALGNATGQKQIRPTPDTGRLRQLIHVHERVQRRQLARGGIQIPNILPTEETADDQPQRDTRIIARCHHCIAAERAWLMNPQDDRVADFSRKLLSQGVVQRDRIRGNFWPAPHLDLIRPCGAILAGSNAGQPEQRLKGRARRPC